MAKHIPTTNDTLNPANIPTWAGAGKPITDTLGPPRSVSKGNPTSVYLGLGDVVEIILVRLGIAKWFKDRKKCGCTERKRVLNKVRTPFRRTTGGVFTLFR